MVVYHHQSGDTHLLSAAFLPLIEFCLKENTFDTDDLLNQCQGLADTVEEKKALADVFLQQFIDFNILRPAICDC